MRYFTKEWYNGTLVADMCFQLRKNEYASTFSDAFFEKLYKVEERAYVKYSKRMAKASKTVFDKDAAIAEFASNYNENLEFVRANLPSDILDNVKDIRVLALGTATNDIAMEITRYCGKQNRLCEAAEREYNNASEEADEAVGAHVVNALARINGSSVEDISHSGSGDVKIVFSDPMTENETCLDLINAKLSEGEADIKGMTVLRHELLISNDGGLEFSLLLLSPDSSLFTISYNTESIK